MIGTELHNGQGLGNAIFCYVATRCVARKQNTEFAVLGKERLEGIAGKGMVCILWTWILVRQLRKKISNKYITRKRKESFLETPNMTVNMDAILPE